MSGTQTYFHERVCTSIVSKHPKEVTSGYKRGVSCDQRLVFIREKDFCLDCYTFTNRWIDFYGFPFFFSCGFLTQMFTPTTKRNKKKKVYSEPNPRQIISYTDDMKVVIETFIYVGYVKLTGRVKRTNK